MALIDRVPQEKYTVVDCSMERLSRECWNMRDGTYRDITICSTAKAGPVQFRVFEAVMSPQLRASQRQMRNKNYE